jgi:hypothetical protein
VYLSKDFICDPQVLMLAFLEMEQKHRCLQVEKIINELAKKILAGQRAERQLAIDKKGEDVQESSDKLNIRVGALKIQTRIWQSQLSKISAICAPIAGTASPKQAPPEQMFRTGNTSTSTSTSTSPDGPPDGDASSRHTSIHEGHFSISEEYFAIR